MDITKQYIKMCERAVEIQEMWEPGVGDWFLHDWHGTLGIPKEVEEVFWPNKDQWERIECLAYKPAIDDYIEISEADGSHAVYTSSSLLKDRHIWLPRQDQLQGILGSYGARQLLQVFSRFALSVNENELSYVRQFSSLEQLWLAFVMKEKYNKVWDGEDWAMQE